MKKILSIAKYLVLTSIAFGLLWIALKNYSLTELLDDLLKVDYTWVFVSVFVSLLSHWFRAYRWNLLLKPLGYSNLSTTRTFMALMSGYLVNLAVPRMGEITRCGMLKKMDDIPMSNTVGTVLTERVFDLIMLVSLLLLTLSLEFTLLKDFIYNFLNENIAKFGQTIDALYTLSLWLGGAFTVSIGIIVLFRRKIKKSLNKYTLFQKVSAFLKQLVEGLMSFRKLENIPGFFFSTFMIWFCYFVMSYVVFWSIPGLESLSWIAGLAVTVFGGIAMTAPVQGGIGTYHLIVPAVLLAYGINSKDGLLYATVVHSSQTLSLLTVGGISMIGSILISKKKIEKSKELDYEYGIEDTEKNRG